MSPALQVVAVFLTLILAPGAATAVPPSRPESVLLGEWIGTSENAKHIYLEFRDDGSATWTTGTPLEIHHSASPQGDDQIALDLNGFTSGPFAGRTLYCLAQVTAESHLRMNCEPGATADARPSSYDPKQTLLFRRP